MIFASGWWRRSFWAARDAAAKRFGVSVASAVRWVTTRRALRGIESVLIRRVVDLRQTGG
jgi:hypothetical protein